jgi:hypothetical protein
MLILGHIFYAFGLIVLLLDFLHLLGFNKIYKVSEWISAFKKINKKNPKKRDYRSEEDYSFATFQTLFIALEFFWLVFGLLSSSWKVFIFIFIIGLVIKGIQFTINKLSGSEFNIVDKFLSYPYLIFKCALIVVLIINHFHLHINLI